MVVWTMSGGVTQEDAFAVLRIELAIYLLSPTDEGRPDMKITEVEPFILHLPLTSTLDLGLDPQDHPLGGRRRAARDRDRPGRLRLHRDACALAPTG